MDSRVLLVCTLACVAAAMAAPQWQQGGPNGNPNGNNGNGGWNVGVDQNRNGGTQVHAQGQKKWDVSKDGKVQAEVHGHWDRTYGGPNKGQRDHGAGASIGGSWGKK